MSLEAV
jgi:hypothetical protein